MKKIIVPLFAVLLFVISAISVYWVAGMRLRNNPKLVSSQERRTYSLTEVEKLQPKHGIKPDVEYYRPYTVLRKVQGSWFGWSMKDSVIYKDTNIIYYDIPKNK